MNKLRPSLILTLLLAPALLTACSLDSAHPLVGKPAPDVTVFTMDGEQQPLKVRAAGAKVHLVEFWATWCGPCRFSMPMVKDLAGEFGKRGLVVTAINQAEPPELVSDYVRATNMDADVVLDPNGAASIAFDATSIPLILLIDADGIVQASYVGYSNSLYREIYADIETLLQGRSLVPASATP